MLHEVPNALTLSEHKGRLRVQGPQQFLDTSPLIDELRKHKDELLAALKEGSAQGEGSLH
ncbi:hypothetical protein MYX82_13195 [Acidobacteria bacterium AH-259-D05]|nr:hypothetical protein [Acidobacteria bacterium AH-259-D05]